MKVEETTIDMRDGKSSAGAIESGYLSEEGESIHALRPVISGGRLGASKFLKLAEIAETYGDGTLRLTSRQGIEIPGIRQSELSAAHGAVDAAGFNTARSIGNNLRNITLPPFPLATPMSAELQALASDIVQSFNDNEPELPHKLKIGLGTFEDNRNDILTNDIAILASENNFLLLLGGGAGGLPESEGGARLAEPVCNIKREQILPALQAIVNIFVRESAGRERSQSRLKHVFARHGPDWFRSEISTAIGTELQAVTLVPKFGSRDLLGWHEQGEGKLWFGFPMLAGRIVDIVDRQTMSGFKGLATDFELDMIVTSDQNIILTGINSEDQDRINQHLRKFGCWTAEELTPMSASEITCPGAPVCRVADAAAENIRHQLIHEMEAVMDEFYVRDIPLTFRLAGCARGCSRPYTGEIGIVGESDDKYAIYLGGLADGTRLGTRRAEGISSSDLPYILEPIFELYSEDCETAEPFGEFINRCSDEEISGLIAEAIEARRIAWAL